MAQGSLRVLVAHSARNRAAASSSRNAAFLARAPDAALVLAGRLRAGSLLVVERDRGTVALAAETVLDIDQLRGGAGKSLPTPEGHFEVDRVDLHGIAAGARPLRGD